MNVCGAVRARHADLGRRIRRANHKRVSPGNRTRRVPCAATAKPCESASDRKETANVGIFSIGRTISLLMRTCRSYLLPDGGLFRRGFGYNPEDRTARYKVWGGALVIRFPAG